MHKIGKNSEVQFMLHISDMNRISQRNKEQFEMIHNYYDTELQRSHNAISPPLSLPILRQQSQFKMKKNSKYVKNQFEKLTKTRNISPLQRLEKGARFNTIRKPAQYAFDGKKFSTITARGYDFDRRLTQSALGNRAPEEDMKITLYQDDYVAGEITMPRSRH